MGPGEHGVKTTEEAVTIKVFALSLAEILLKGEVGARQRVSQASHFPLE